MVRLAFPPCFLISLILCWSGSLSNGIKFRLSSKPASPTPTTNVVLECEVTDNSLADSGVSWIRHDKSDVPYFVLFISSISRVTPNNHQKYLATKSSNKYTLTVKGFSEKDQGDYYCIVNRNQELHFSRGLPLYLPAPRTTPQTTTTTTQAPTQPSGQDGGVTDCKDSSNSEKTSHNGLGFSCDLYIWAPLAGGCLLLLIALVAVVSVCQKSRRRRCKCKRPTNGAASGKLNMPNRYV